ncbi:hypothetical protein F8O07_07030 [Pseudoclavibacter sp. CFCC 13796]|uniref:hypothetical protein n=1 Tax=Pseudoclavibacter sp. CFCC 13796 TaxID=2615179 RepID=UPI001300F2F9|nr:hypothetical protein [Pseudoclavibacter sp. CFCC 13796]KAB1661653.1 hypothetical protein F8O07_07030 [Pseudoclavibacter sp. CFCC 13796]
MSTYTRDGQPTAPYRLEFPDGNRLEGESPSDLISGLIPGYEALTDDEALEARVDHMEEHADTLQAMLLIGLAADQPGDGDPADPLDKDDRLFLTTPKDQAVTGEYHGPIDLILTTTQYQPYTDDERPTGRIVWLDPETETSFLTTLAESSDLTYVTAE